MDELISVSLHGGPEALPRTIQVEKSKLEDGKLKIEHRGGYEHFERSAPDRNPGVTPHNAGSGRTETFSWTLRTKIAE